MNTIDITKIKNLKDAADTHIRNVMGEFYGIDKEEVIALISVFEAGANWQKEKDKDVIDKLTGVLADINERYICSIAVSKGATIDREAYEYRPHPINEANAAFICLAVNNHKLVKALEDLLSSCIYANVNYPAINQAQEVLKQQEGTK